MSAFLAGNVNGIALVLFGAAFAGLGIWWLNRPAPFRVGDPAEPVPDRPHLTVIQGGGDVYDQEVSGS